MESEQQALFIALLRRLRGMDACVNSGIFRTRSKNEESAPKAQGYYSFFCIHDRHKWSPCKQCGRSKAEGDRAREAYREELAAVITQA